LLQGHAAYAVVAPARLEDATGLPPAYIEVGELDIFRDESVAYARKLWQAGVSAELHVHPGLVHGFDHVLPGAEFTRRALDDRVRALRRL
jgi:acetyl esterase/lipase